MTQEERNVSRDRLRYIKNSSSSRLCYLAILLDVLYFISICKSDVGTYYYNIMIGAVILYNLAFLLAVFLASEGVKNYKRGFSFLLIAAGIGQIIRIFIIPMKAHREMTVVNGAETLVMRDGQFIRVLIYLLVSAVCLLLAAAINLYKCKELAAHQKELAAQAAA